MLELTQKTKEVNISLQYSETIGGKIKIDIVGEGDFSHHLIEELFMLMDKLARMEKIGHQSSEIRQRKPK